MKGLALTTLLAILAAATAVGVVAVGIHAPELLPEPLRTFFTSVKFFFELLRISFVLEEVKLLGFFLMLPLILGLLYLILRLLRGGG